MTLKENLYAAQRGDQKKCKRKKYSEVYSRSNAADLDNLLQASEIRRRVF